MAMTNETAGAANDTGLRKEARPKTRQQLQDDALIVENLLNAVMALGFDENAQDAMTIVEMAHDRAHELNVSLDSQNFAEGAR